MKTNTALADEQLILAIRQGNTEAFGELYDRYYKKVYHKCYSFTKNQQEAFDYAQESLMKAFDNLDTFRGQASFSTWLYTITHHHCIAGLKKNSRLLTTALSEQYQEGERSHTSISADDSNDRSEQETIMFTLINHLPEGEKTLLTLKYEQGESIEVLQQKMGLNASAVKMRLKRSKEKLNAMYMLALTYGIEQVLEMMEMF